MTVDLQDEQGFFETYPKLYEKVIEVIERCLEVEQVPYETEISLTLTDEHSIHEINKTYRSVDRVTDVLSFPQIEPERMGVINWDTVDYSDCTNFDTEELILGDIIICSERAKQQAESYGHSLEREICFLVAHSMFHLLGYDHMNEEDEKVMVKKQEDVLQYLSIIR